VLTRSNLPGSPTARGLASSKFTACRDGWGGRWPDALGR
jgi:hypothetical protein